MTNPDGVTVKTRPALDDMLTQYLAARGIPLPVVTTASKVRDEAQELMGAIADGDEAGVRHEIADVVLAAAVVARRRGVTVEQCIAEKIVRDHGRGDGPR